MQEGISCSYQAGENIYLAGAYVLVLPEATGAAQHFGMLLAFMEGINGQGEGYYPINTADHMNQPLCSAPYKRKGWVWKRLSERGT